MNRKVGAALACLVVSGAGCTSNDTQAGPVPAQAAAGVGGPTSGGASTSGTAGNGGGSGMPISQVAGAGSGGAAGSSAGGTSGGAGSSGSGGQAPSLNELASAFENFRMDLPCDHYQDVPCEPQNSGTPNRGYLCCYVDETSERQNHPRVDQELVLGGDAALVYEVTLRIRGVVENRDYLDQGTKLGDWVRVGGALPPPGAIHVFGITTRDPEQTYFLNSWNDTSDVARLIALDYEVTVPMRGGSQVRVFEYDDIGKIWSNAESLKVEGVTPYPDAFDGQFMQLNVVSVKPRQ